jgi:hypothetical protein
VQRKRAILKDGPDADGEGLAAVLRIALIKARPGGLTPKATDFLGVAAVGADRSVWPKLCFNVSERRFLVVKPIGIENGLGHDVAPMAKTLHLVTGYGK